MINPRPARSLLPFDYYRQVVNGQVVTYEKAGSGQGYLTSSIRTWILVATIQLPVGTVVRNLKDAKGTALQTAANGEDFDLFVNSSSPVLDNNSVSTGWRHVLSQNDPEAFRNALLALAGQAV